MQRLRRLETQGDGSGGIFVVMSPLGSDKEQGGLFGHSVNGVACTDEQELWIMARAWRDSMEGRGSRGKKCSFGRFLMSNLEGVLEHRRGDVTALLNQSEIEVPVNPWPANAIIVLMWEN